MLFPLASEAQCRYTSLHEYVILIFAAKYPTPLGQTYDMHFWYQASVTYFWIFLFIFFPKEKCGPFQLRHLTTNLAGEKNLFKAIWKLGHFIIKHKLFNNTREKTKLVFKGMLPGLSNPLNWKVFWHLRWRKTIMQTSMKNSWQIWK